MNEELSDFLESVKYHFKNADIIRPLNFKGTDLFFDDTTAIIHLDKSENEITAWISYGGGEKAILAIGGKFAKIVKFKPETSENVRIITEFQLGGVKWNVVNNSQRLDDLNFMGLCESSKATITLNDKIASPDVYEQTFYHELVHAILESLDRNELSHDEIFVQSFANLLHQFQKTKK